MVTCKDCLHCRACHEMYLVAVSQEDDFFERMDAETCEDFKDKYRYIELPKLQFGQTLYLVDDGKIRPLQVTSYTVRPEFGNMIQIHLYRNGFNGCCTLDDFGKTVFLTKEEVEKALKERDRK